MCGVTLDGSIVRSYLGAYPMRVRVLFFALYRDLVGTGELELELPAGATAGALVRVVRERGGGFARIPPDPVLAVNHEYASPAVALRDGDEVAFLPPVAGG